MLISRFLLIFALVLVGCNSNSASDNATESFDDQKQFLLDNAARDKVLVTNSGLQYEVLRAGSGPSPNADAVVTVHYIGTLTDGTEFDNSYSRNVASTFNLGGTIPGWIEGLQLMNVGSSYRFVIPARLAYGESGRGVIGPNAVLIFVIDLLEINS